jgi:hypothetical protein
VRSTGPPVVWKLSDRSFNLYVWPEEDVLKAYRFDGQKFQTTPIGSSTPWVGALMSMPGGVLSLSWDGTDAGSAIIWAARPNPGGRPAVGGPFVSVFHNQQHYAWRDTSGSVWDSFFDRGEGRWHSQRIGTTDSQGKAHPAAGAIFVSVFDSADQQHFAYTDSAENIWDSFFVRSTNSWHFQQINTKDAQGTHSPAGGIFVSSFHDQQHFAFRDKNGAIWDSFDAQSGNSWHFQQINTKDGNGKVHPAAGDVFVSVFDAADQQHYVYADSAGDIWDSFFVRGSNSWHFQQINTKDAQGTHRPVGRIFVSAFHDQQHFVFRDSGGAIWDSFYAQTGNAWHFQRINTTDAQGTVHAAAGDVFVSVFDAADQQHFAYPDASGRVWDSFFNRGNNSWHFQSINTSDAHGAHTAVGEIFVSAYFDQQHFAFTDRLGSIWDAFYAQAGNSWHFQEINSGCGFGSGDPHDLTPNDAPCNAINKIVPGFLQAFNATPGTGGQLTELWNSEMNANDRVRWFAKESPPTIADGKVFLPEFPAKPANANWNASNATGRLIVYGLGR